MKYYIGVDPGQTGAIAILDQDGKVILIEDYPGDEVAAFNKIAHIILLPNPANQRIIAAIEKVSAMPKQGVSSVFKFGTNFGIWRGILAAHGIPIHFVRPQEWQKGRLHKIDGSDTKTQSLAAARRMFPDQIDKLNRKKDHNRADALLIVHWLRRKELGGE